MNRSDGYVAHETGSGRFIPARWDDRRSQYVTPVCCPGWLYAYARTIDRLAAETGRTYATATGAMAALRRTIGASPPRADAARCIRCDVDLDGTDPGTCTDCADPTL